MLIGPEFNNCGEYLVREGQIPSCLSNDEIVSIQACTTPLTVKYEFWELNLGSHVTFVTKPSSGPLAESFNIEVYVFIKIKGFLSINLTTYIE